MNISRRDFLGSMTSAAATLWSFRPIGLDTLGSRLEPDLDCVLVDLNSHCTLRESFQGYQVALANEHNHLKGVNLNSRLRCRMAIVPGLGVMGPAVAATLAGLLKAGTNLLLESGAGFLGPSEFASHQNMLDRYFDIAIDPPVNLWSAESTDKAFYTHRAGRHPRTNRDSREPVPYVNYVWPREAKVRDFSRVIPVSAREGDLIGRVGAFPVALKRRVAMGTLIFLGSPMGPALRAGDSEARSWLRLVSAL